MTQTNTIKVHGIGALKIAPDTIRLNLNVHQIFSTNDEAFEQSKHNLKSLEDRVESAGLDTKEIKTSCFKISENTKPVYEKDKWVGYEKNGYVLNQQLYIDFPIDSDKINGIVEFCTEHIPCVEISLGAILSDPRKYKLEAISLAVKDAQMKAQTIASTLGCSLGTIAEVNYGRNENSYSISTMCDCSTQESAGCDPLHINGEDIEFEEHVEIIWLISSPW